MADYSVALFLDQEAGKFSLFEVSFKGPVPQKPLFNS
jgi:hypothetical protein